MVFTALPSIIVKKLKESMGLDLILNIGNFQGETFADQFASAYGYSADFSSAMRKMRLLQKSYHCSLKGEIPGF